MFAKVNLHSYIILLINQLSLFFYYSEPICSNIIDTTNKHLMDRLEIKRDYTWVPVINKATEYIDELIDNVCFKDLSLITSLL